MHDTLFTTTPADILIVDDIIENLRLLTELLSNQGYNVRPASNGEDAIDAVRERKPELILLDIKMPSMDGYEVCRRLKADERSSEIPVVFVTATADPEGASKGLALGAVDYITKPFKEDEVLARVRTHIELYRMRRHLAKESAENRARYRRLIEGLKDEYFFYAHGIDGVFNYLSPSVEQILGYTPDEFLTHFTDYLTDNEINKQAKANTAESIQGKQQPSYELEIYCKDRSRCWLEVKETPLFDGKGNVVGVEGIAHDITQRKAFEVERKQHQQQLQTSLRQTIQAVAQTIEKRDPYTAGHQRRVADLACAIAEAMGVDAQLIDGLRMGAMIHDIGKIYIPAEFLTKPGSLTSAEFDIIKTHCEEGRLIVRGIDFPWPVAEMIHQHHERLDGSGYPQGLKGKEILLEARILAVADVVEAMSNDRPYRPGMGIGPALDEVKKGRSVLYEAEVVDQCIKLFERGFSLEKDK